MFVKLLLLLLKTVTCDWLHCDASQRYDWAGCRMIALPSRPSVRRRPVVSRQTDNASKYSSIDDRITRIIRLCVVRSLQLSEQLLFPRRHFYSCSFTLAATSVKPVMLHGASASLATTGVRLSALKLQTRRALFL